MHGATALYLAAQGGFEAVAAALLDAGAEVDAALEKIGLTPLFIASAQGYLPVVRLLLGRGAAVGSRNWNGLSPLHMAALRGNTAIAQLLRDHGAAVVSTKTALLVAVPSLSDLERSGTWQAFLNKAAYCRRTNRPLYVFVGVPQLLHSRLDAPWAKCRERGSSASLKAVALLSLFEDPNPPDRVLYMEGTAFLSDLAFGDDEDAPEAYLALAPAAELVMRRDLDPSIFLTKRSAWSSQVLALWWRGQCGADDALPLASTLYASWSAATDGKLEFERPTFETRAGARKKASTILEEAPAIRHDAGITSQFYGGDTTPLELPKTLLLPSFTVGELPALDALIAETGSACAGGKCEPFLASSWSFAGAIRWLLFLVVLGAGAYALAARPDLLRELLRTVLELVAAGAKYLSELRVS